jgi:hypothetical protein
MTQKLDRNEILVVGACIDCGGENKMPRRVKEKYDQLVRLKSNTDQPFVFPTRCRDCMDRRKKNKFLNSRLRESLAEMRLMMDHAINNEYDNRGDALAQELADTASKIEKCIGG